MSRMVSEQKKDIVCDRDRAGNASEHVCEEVLEQLFAEFVGWA